MNNSFPGICTAQNCVSVPKNCTSCDCARGCDSWYGGTACKYRDQIAKGAAK